MIASNRADGNLFRLNAEAGAPSGRRQKLEREP
jgi:hypothetical protein